MYQYQIFPDQTIVECCEDGYSFGELCDELEMNGVGVIVAGEESDDLAKALAGLRCPIRTQRTDHGAGRKSVQIFSGDDELLRDIEW